MCFRHFDRGSQINFHLRYLTAGTELSTLGNTFSCLVNSCSVGARRAVFLLTLYSYYHGVYKNGMPMTESIQTYSSCTQFILKGLFFGKQNLEFNTMLFSSSIWFASTFVVGLGGERAHLQTAAQDP